MCCCLIQTRYHHDTTQNFRNLLIISNCLDLPTKRLLEQFPIHVFTPINNVHPVHLNIPLWAQQIALGPLRQSQSSQPPTIRKARHPVREPVPKDRDPGPQRYVRFHLPDEAVPVQPVQESYEASPLALCRLQQRPRRLGLDLEPLPMPQTPVPRDDSWCGILQEVLSPLRSEWSEGQLEMPLLRMGWSDVSNGDGVRKMCSFVLW
jgi:hypothetical protein